MSKCSLPLYRTSVKGYVLWSFPVRTPVTEYNSQSNHYLPWLGIEVTYSFQKLVAGFCTSYKRYEQAVAVPVAKKTFRVTLAVLESAISTQKLSFVDFLLARTKVFLISILNMDHLPSPPLLSGNSAEGTNRRWSC